MLRGCLQGWEENVSRGSEIIYPRCELDNWKLSSSRTHILTRCAVLYTIATMERIQVLNISRVVCIDAAVEAGSLAKPSTCWVSCQKALISTAIPNLRAFCTFACGVQTRIDIKPKGLLAFCGLLLKTCEHDAGPVFQKLIEAYGNEVSVDKSTLGVRLIDTYLYGS